MKNYASYHKCVLQMNPFFYASYRGDTCYIEKEYNELILQKCLDNSISVVGLANHGSVDSSESLRNKLQDGGITVFPGFEVTSAEKVHMVCLFPPEKSKSDLNRYLGLIGLGDVRDGTETSSKTCLDIADQVKTLGGFWYAAHITGENGILKLGKLNHIWKDERLVAAQIPNSKENIDPQYVQIIKNNDPQYKRKKMPALINAKDIEKPEDLENETAVTLVKLTTVTFENFKAAFMDPDSRIRLLSEKEDNHQSSIKSISVIGGYLNGLAFELPDNLSAIIGGRGTGKSTIINLLRYALKLDINAEQKKSFNSMIEANLGSAGRIELEIISNAQFGKMFKVIRRYNQDPVVQDEAGKVSSLAIVDILPNIEIYGQNEIAETLTTPEKINKAVSRLLVIDEDIYNEKQAAYQNLLANGEELDRLEEDEDSCNESVGDLPALEERLRFFKESGVEDRLSSIKKLSTEEGQFISFGQKMPKTAITIPEVPIIESENDDLKLLSEAAKMYNSELSTIVGLHKEAIQKLKSTFEKCRENWSGKKAEYEKDIRESLKQIEGISDKSATEIASSYGDLVKRIEVAKPAKERLANIKAQIVRLKRERRDLIEAYRVCCDNTDQKMSRIVTTINRKKLNGKMRLSINFRQQKQPILSRIMKIDGIGEKSVAGINQYKDFDVFSFADDVRKGAEVLRDKYSIGQSVADKICRDFTESILRQIEQMQLADVITVELEVNGQYKDLEHLSKGQQCTAILNILLIDNKDPLIIDQPEDNLDNSYIAENLVETIRANKIKRQYVFATHNANIPVFGDAELIVTMEEVDGHGKIVEDGIGSIDSLGVKKRVISILEGGSEAFKMRESKYGI